MYEFKRLATPLDIQPLNIYQSFTVAPYNDMLKTSETLSQLIVIAVLANSAPIGLGVLAKDLKEAKAQLVSIFIEKEHRQQHLASQLLALLEQELLKEKDAYHSILARYPFSSPTAPFFEHMLFKQKWELKEVIFGGKIPNNAQFDWLQKPLRLPRGFEIFKWKDLSQAERKSIQDRHQQAPWFPFELSPFTKEEDIEYLNSLGLRSKGEIAGWVITHRLFIDTIQYWCLFVDPPLQKTGIGMRLLAEAIRLQVEAYPPLIYGLFLFRMERIIRNHQLGNFFKKKLAPYCSTLMEVHESEKKL